MSATVRDFMNPKIVYLREGTRPEVARRFIVRFGITAVPVIGPDERPVGVVSLRDLVDCAATETRMSEPARTVGVDEPIDKAARALAEADLHHLVVVDRAGRAVGMLSALDVIRGLVGLEPKHPPAIGPFDVRSATAE
ncbi:MAG TPA: CBS domain-containing protein [Polyangiaceae bacterium]|nr:CBS domain-containing protein [Polyangiaceae bacterium]